ncbi:MAG: hypothetical protein LBL45_01180 [Treponema sp.]|jgi:ABC-2 type transport system ATP-binding protein|nr:hypothetical protein [Treponema sp.]
MSAYDNLAMQCRIKGVRDTAKKKAHNFSLDMRLALALVGDPDFLLLDEPANGLNPEDIIEMRELFLRISIAV